MQERQTLPQVPPVHHHPAAKWMLVVAMLAVTGLGLPRPAEAAAPSVQAPVGPQSGGSFSGPFTFNYFISCSNGVSYNSSYTSNLDGTNTFAFYGANDGSLLLGINGGGHFLLNSCGDPGTGSALVASYTVSKNTAPPATPAPTPVPATPTPTPVPVTGSGSSSGGSSGGGAASGGGTAAGRGGSQVSSGSGGHAAATGAASTPPSTAPTDAAAAPAVNRIETTPAMVSAAMPAVSAAPVARSSHQSAGHPLMLGWAGWLGGGAALLLLAVLGAFAWSRRVSLRHRWTVMRMSWAWRLEPVIFKLRHALVFRHGAGEVRRFGTSHHKYTGRLMAHHHTSYPALAFLILATSVLAAGASLGSEAASTTVSLTVNGPAPTQGATITSPAAAANFTTSPITIMGTCPAGLRVELSRNTAFAGSVMCDSVGSFSLPVSLTEGANELAALVYDGLDQTGPATLSVNITYNPPAAPIVTTPQLSSPQVATGSRTGQSATPRPRTATVGTAVPSLVVATNRHYYSGLATGDTLDFPVLISGGVAPYKSAVQWGDDAVTRQVLTSPGTLTPSHSYVAAGIYNVTATVTDARGRTAVISVVTVVAGPAAALAAPASPRQDGAMLGGGIIWPLLAGTALVALSFWLGEHDWLSRRKNALAVNGPVQPS